MKTVITLLILLLLSNTLLANESKNSDDVDYIALAGILLKDGYYSRADNALKSVDLDALECDKAQYYTLEGLIALKLSAYKRSNKSFYLAIENGQTQKSLYLYIAQNSFKLKEYKQTLDALEHAQELVDKEPKLLALKAECFYRLKEYTDAFDTLALINKTHPSYYAAYKQRFRYLIDLKLYQSALEDADIYLEHTKSDEKVSISFINALKKAKETKKATLLAEKAHLEYPNNVTITILLANLYIEQDMIESAATLFDLASLQDEKYIKDSSEIFRRAHDYIQALYKNSQILDTKEKYKQKVAIYLEFGNYERVIATESALKRNDLLEEQNMIYALAFSFYKVGEFQQSEKYLQMLTDSKLFTKAIELRKNMNKCTNNPWECQL